MLNKFDSWLTEVCLNIYDYLTRELALCEAEVINQLKTRKPNV